MPAGACGSEDSVGPLYLHDCTQQLHQHYIEFIHRADQDLRQRILQLNGEASTQRRALHELQASCKSAQQRGSDLLVRVRQAAELQKNLAERSGDVAAVSA
jgi:hypothetical protein